MKGGISVWTATAIVVANMVGTGVFTSLGFQLVHLDSTWSVLGLWIAGGVASLCGALCYGELAARFPRSGGEYNLLTRIYHPALGFMGGWIAVTVGFAAPIALAAMAFGKYLSGASGSEHPVVFSLSAVVACAGVHALGVSAGAKFQNVFTVLKIGLIIGLTVCAFLVGEAAPQPQGTAFWKEVTSPPWAVGLIYVMYAYSGWNAAVYVADEVRDPVRNVPRALLWGTGIVILLYVMLNAAFLYVAPRQELRGQIEIGLIAGKWIFGESGGRLAAGLIAAGLVSAISAMVWTGSRVASTMGEDYHILRFLSRRSKGGAPVVAILLQTALVVALIVTSSFEQILIYTQIVLLLCSLLCVAGLFILRRDQSSPVWKIYGYPWTPAVFVIITVFMIGHTLWEKPVQSLAGIATMAAGLLIYFLEPGENRRRLVAQSHKGKSGSARD